MAIQGKVLGYLISVLLRELSTDKMRELADMVLDYVEDKIIGTDNKLDDKLLPLIATIRSTFSIPDND